NYSLLKRRFHKGLLPVPKEKYFFKPFISNKGKVHPVLIKQIRRIINLNKPLLVFVPRIKDLPVYKKHLTTVFKEKKIVSVYAGDKERQSKVARFRNQEIDRKSTRLNSSHVSISYAVFCLKKKQKK